MVIFGWKMFRLKNCFLSKILVFIPLGNFRPKWRFLCCDHIEWKKVFLAKLIVFDKKFFESKIFLKLKFTSEAHWSVSSRAFLSFWTLRSDFDSVALFCVILSPVLLNLSLKPTNFELKSASRVSTKSTKISFYCMISVNTKIQT